MSSKKGNNPFFFVIHTPKNTWDIPGVPVIPPGLSYERQCDTEIFSGNCTFYQFFQKQETS